jgi:uncharacterized protein (TIGR02099 family)
MSSISNLTGAARSTPEPCQSRAPWWRKALQALAWSMAALWSLLLIAWLTLHWGILNHIEQWRPEIQARASTALRTTVQIGHIEAGSSGWMPTVHLRDVVLLDAAGRPALRLPRVTAAVSPRSLLALDLRLDQMLIEGAELEVRRDALGRLYVGGLDFSGAGAIDGDRAAANWFFKQPEFVVRGGSLRWTDEQRLAPPLALTDVSLVMRNGVRQHDIRLDATPPAGWGERFSLQGRFTQPLLADSGDWRRWSGTATADLPHADVSELRRYVSLPFELSHGEGALRAWLELAEGDPRELTLDMALRSVTMRLASHVEPLGFEQVEGRLSARRSDDSLSVRAQQFGFVTADGLRWPRGDLTLSLRQRRDGASTQPVSGGEFNAQRLDLGVMTQIAERLPLGDALRKLLAELAPKGVVNAMSARWDGPLDDPSHYDVKATFSGLTLAARASSEPRAVGRPGLRNADIELGANQDGGQARVALNGGALEFPGVFEEALLPLDKLSAQLTWRMTPGKEPAAPRQLEVKVSDAIFANADAQGDLSGTWRSGAGAQFGRGARYPGQLELSGKLTRGLAARTARYLPLGLPDSVRRYVARAVTGGHLAGVNFRVKGDLWDFPFVGSRQGEFRIAARLEDVIYAYLPSVPASATEAAFASTWPALTKVHGELVFDRSSMEVRNAQARVDGFELKRINGGIRNLAERSVLVLEGNGRGPLADALRYVNSSPVGRWIGDALGRTTASGIAELRLGLNIPLYDTSKGTVQGSVLLAGNDIRISPETPLLAAARGRVDFTQRHLSVSGGSARVLGGDASFEGGLRGDGSLRFAGQGVATADGLRRATELPQLARIAASLNGQTAYRISLGFTRGHTELAVTSNLVGLGSELPAPVRKAAETSLPMRFQTSLLPESLEPGQSARDTLHFELGNVVQAQFVRDLSQDAPLVLRGGIGVLDAVPSSASGVAANLNLGSVDADAWGALARRLGGLGAGDGADGGNYLPHSVALRAQEITTGTRSITKLVAGISQSEGVWRANIDADQLNGYIEYRMPRRAASALVHARLARLSLPRAEAEGVESLLDDQPANLPALDIVVDDFELRGKRLGRIEIEALNRSSGEAREWRLSRLNMNTPEANLSATGSWGGSAPGASAAGSSRKRVVMTFKLDLADSGGFLERFGTAKAIKGGKGRITGQVAWPGSPLSPDFKHMNGQLNLAVESGQFLKVEPGVTRLLGVLSLQSLPRRLALDFRDLFQEGFAFDSVTGDLKIAQGVASTNNLRMRGVQAAVLIEGRADITRETQDLRVVVVPEINAGTASLAYAAINPAIGLGTFLAQIFLRKPMMQAGTREFHVAGPWADPKVVRVERKPGDPIPEFDSATPAAASTTPTTP